MESTQVSPPKKLKRKNVLALIDDIPRLNGTRWRKQYINLMPNAKNIPRLPEIFSETMINLLKNLYRATSLCPWNRPKKKNTLSEVSVPMREQRKTSDKSKYPC